MYKPISNGFSYGKYDDFKLIIMNSNGYINATKLCEQYNEVFDNWLYNGNNSKELISEITDVDNVLIEIEEGDPLINGMYVHQLLIPHIISWISPKFAIKVSKIVNDFIISEYKISIREKDDNISKLREEVQELLRYAKDSKHTLEVTNELVLEIRDDLHHNTDILDKSVVNNK